MTSLTSVIDDLRAVTVFAAEYEGPKVPSSIEQKLAALLRIYPQLQDYGTYLEFLRTTGGAHIHTPIFSLGIYGFAGYIVRSFDEGLELDQNKYFVFADFIYCTQKSPRYYFSFDFASEGEFVFMVIDEEPDFTLYCNSFLDFLSMIAKGQYPNLTVAPK